MAEPTPIRRDSPRLSSTDIEALQTLIGALNEFVSPRLDGVPDSFDGVEVRRHYGSMHGRLRYSRDEEGFVFEPEP